MTKTIKKDFAIFESNPDLVYLDSGATALKPRVVLETMNDYYANYSANIHRGIYPLSEKASAAYETAREKVAEFIGGQKDEVIFTSGTTEGINMVALGWGEEEIKKGDEIVVTEMEHHANLVPWQQLTLRKGAKLNYVEINDQFQISNDQWEKVISVKTKLVAITQVSNVLGTINPIKEIIKKIKTINSKAVVVVDGAQAVAHFKVDVADMGADFYAFSGHKLYGPTGIGVLWGKKELLEKMRPVKLGGGMIAEVNKYATTWAPIPAKFEGGTPAIAEAVGLGAAIDWLGQNSWSELQATEEKIKNYLWQKLDEIEGVTTYGPQGQNQSGVVSLSMAGIHPHDVAEVLARDHICVRSGHHCAMPLHQKLGVLGTTRISLGIYSTKEDIDKLIEGLKKVKIIFKL